MSMWWLIFLLFIVGTGYCSFENRILYGNIVDPAFYDWSIVQIRSVSVDKKNGMCTGTLISNRHILTALHCVQDPQARMHTKFQVNILNNPEWNGKILIRSQHVDIAIIEFPKDTIFDKPVLKMALAGDDFNDPIFQAKINNEGFVAGYGYKDFDHDSEQGIYDGNLRVAKVPLWPAGWCHGIKSRICTSDYSPLAVGRDSGGPLFFKKFHISTGYYVKAYQFGVMVTVDISSKYNLHTPISTNCGWIEDVTNGEAKCQTIFPNSRFRRSRSLDA